MSLLEDEIDDLLDDAEPTSDSIELYEHYRVVADKGQSLLRVDKFLFDHIEHVSRNRIQKAAEAGMIMANGSAVKSNYKVKPLDVITVMM
ncbi:MAG: RNA pseudouridine synthase, partial [Bacteroidaceae bacterium]|nr:RNA pseudouridine synthase [Bacteroidaceae bacterium]